MNSLTETAFYQDQLARYCRDGKSVDLPGLTPGRVHHYRRLVFGVVRDAMETAYPIAHDYIDAEEWEKLLYHFFEKHQCKSAQIWQLPFEFYEFFTEHYQSHENFDFLSDLLLFEWIEIALFNMPDADFPAHTALGDRFMENHIALNPEHELVAFKYPVHKMKAAEAVNHSGNYYLLAFREAETGNIQFVDLSPWFVVVLERLSQNISPVEIIADSDNFFTDTDFVAITDATLNFILEMNDKGFVLGKSANT